MQDFAAQESLLHSQCIGFSTHSLTCKYRINMKPMWLNFGDRSEPMFQHDVALNVINKFVNSFGLHEIFMPT